MLVFLFPFKKIMATHKSPRNEKEVDQPKPDTTEEGTQSDGPTQTRKIRRTSKQNSSEVDILHSVIWGLMLMAVLILVYEAWKVVASTAYMKFCFCGFAFCLFGWSLCTHGPRIGVTSVQTETTRYEDVPDTEE